MAELYHAQSDRWGSIARRHLDKTVSIVSQFIQCALKHVIKDMKVRESVSKVIDATLEMDIRHAHEELETLLDDEKRQPITYNHYYTDNIQKSRQKHSRKQLQESIDSAIEGEWNGRFHFQNSSDEVRRLVTALQDRVVVNMTEQACIEARNDLAAYYKV